MVHIQAHEDAKLRNGITTVGKRIKVGHDGEEGTDRPVLSQYAFLYALLCSVP